MAHEKDNIIHVATISFFRIPKPNLNKRFHVRIYDVSTRPPHRKCNGHTEVCASLRDARLVTH